jgi:hypothetical protein
MENLNDVPIIVIVAILNSIPPGTSSTIQIPFRHLSTGAFSNQFVDSDNKYITVSRSILNEMLMMTKNITIVYVNTSESSTSNALAIVSILKNPSSASNNTGIFESLNSSTRSDFQDFQASLINTNPILMHSNI